MGIAREDFSIPHGLVRPPSTTRLLMGLEVASNRLPSGRHQSAFTGQTPQDDLPTVCLAPLHVALAHFSGHVRVHDVDKMAEVVAMINAVQNVEIRAWPAKGVAFRATGKVKAVFQIQGLTEIQHDLIAHHLMAGCQQQVKHRLDGTEHTRALFLNGGDLTPFGSSAAAECQGINPCGNGVFLIGIVVWLFLRGTSYSNADGAFLSVNMKLTVTFSTTTSCFITPACTRLRQGPSI